MTASILCEVCVDQVEGALAAERGGAHRIELCAELQAGGTTPSHGLVVTTLERCSLPVFVMIRARSGDFVFDESELETMLSDVRFAKESGASGIVFGALHADGTVNVDQTKAICEAALPLPATFHRAFDHTPDPLRAIAAVIECGCARLLTSGQRPTAHEGKSLIRTLSQTVGERLIVMPGAGVRPDNIASIVSETGCREIHFSASTAAARTAGSTRESRSAVRMGSAPDEPRRITDESIVRDTIRGILE